VSLPPGAREARPVGGGYVNDAYRVLLAGGREAFVKTRAGAAPGEFAAEAADLRWLADAGEDALPAPQVLDVGEDYLALQWIEPGALGAGGGERLGRALAATHAAGAPRFGREAPDGTGTGFQGWIAGLRVSNEPAATWAEFYAERRIRPLAALAHERGALDGRALASLERVCERMPELAGPPEPPARVHGDLWAGNVLAGADGRAWLIDPAAYGGHREVDLAMLALFGAPAGSLEAYREAAPLAEGWRERVELHQLLPLLVHAILFGGSYPEQVARIARRYA
jgi:fructosamine-3-kinase